MIKECWEGNGKVSEKGVQWCYCERWEKGRQILKQRINSSGCGDRNTKGEIEWKEIKMQGEKETKLRGWKKSKWFVHTHSQ